MHLFIREGTLHEFLHYFRRRTKILYPIHLFGGLGM